jgi:hypothetical protein
VGACCFVVALALAACGGRVVIDEAGVGGAGVASGGADSGTAGSGTTAAGGGALSGGGAAGASGGTNSGVAVECPAGSSSGIGPYGAFEGKPCSNVGANCSLGDCSYICHCEATGDSPRWNCVGLGCIPK